MVAMRNSGFDTHECLSSGMKALKGAQCKYLNSIFYYFSDEL